MALPLLAFGSLAAIFWFRLGDGDPSKIPSALIGHPAPPTALPTPSTNLTSTSDAPIQISGRVPETRLLMTIAVDSIANTAGVTRLSRR